MSLYGISTYGWTGRGPVGLRSQSASSVERRSLSRCGSSADVYTSRGESVARTLGYSATNYELQSRSPSPMNLTRGDYEWSRSPTVSRSRAESPSRYAEALIKQSRQLRERSIPKQDPLAYVPLPQPNKRSVTGKPPLPPGPTSPGAARVVASDFYRGKIKSIYEREPLFRDFAKGLRLEEAKLSMYNSGTLDTIKKDFYRMVEDKWARKNCRDPTVEHDLGSKLYPWQNVVGKSGAEPASQRIARLHAAKPRMTTPPPMPKIRLYHKSTLP